MPLLDVLDLHVRFQTERGSVDAVRGLSFSVERGERLAIVGESGSGKSVTQLALTGLLPRTATVTAKRATFDGVDLLTMSPVTRRRILGRRIGMVFQDPVGALAPHMRVGAQVVEAIHAHENVSRAAARARALDLFRVLAIPDPERRFDAYPHELSGGLCQRVMIAIALSAGPDLVFADEPTTALDVTVQAQLLRLMRQITTERNVALVIVSHDLAVVGGVADRVLVMERGLVVEQGAVDAIFRAPTHPVTRGLLAAARRGDAS